MLQRSAPVVRRTNAFRWTAMASFALTTATSLPAAQVDYTLEVNPGAGSWELFAEASAGDNGGIAFVVVQLLNVDTPVDLLLPQALLDPGGGPPPTPVGGFTDFRSSLNPLGGIQPIFGSGAGLVYGFGQTPGDLLSVFSVANAFVQREYDAKLLVARGTYDPGGPAPEFDDGLGAFVFLADGNPDFETPDTITSAVIFVPEPSAALALAAAMLAATSRRRRR